nr:LUD domain-containing protein [Thermanaerosceptrum fracticalcis]
MYHKHKNSDVFLCSTNALTLDGQLINLDGSGNRVSSLIFGPKKIIVIAGVNKIVDNVESGIARVKNVVAPELYRHKNAPAPCAKTGYCINCHPPVKQCRALVILEARPRINTDFHIILVGENLGI